MLRLIFKFYNKFYLLVLEPLRYWVGKLYLKAAGVSFEKGAKILGLPIISLHKGSQIILGENVTFISSSRGNSIGVNHEVILRTQAKGAKIQIGNRVGMSGGAICARSKVVIGDDVLIGANVVIADNDFHPITVSGRQCGEINIETREVLIGGGVWIGADCYICKGVTIGENTVVGAKSVVTKSLPANCVAAGVPAKIIRMLDD